MMFSGKNALKNTLSDQITCVITSCGRFDYLNETVKSFISNTDILPEKFIIIDNSDDSSIFDMNFEGVKEIHIIQNDSNIGQVASIDRAYSLVETPYIFHLEDDWRFHDTGFMGKSLDVLKERPGVVNVNLRNRFDGVRGSMHPLANTNLITKSGTVYHEYQTHYLGTWHGFSWNPGLRRLEDYELIGNYKQYGNEESVGAFYYRKGFISTCLEKSYCEHIGIVSTGNGRNE